MMLHVQYQDEKYDYVESQAIDKLINSRLIKQLYRPAEKRWVIVDHGPIRGMGGNVYVGPERRHFERLSSNADLIIYA